MKKLFIFCSIISLALPCLKLDAQTAYPGIETVIYFDPGVVGTSSVPPIDPGITFRSADFAVNYIGDWPPEAMAAFDYAVSIWEHHLTSSIPIIVDARFEALATDPVLVLGSARATTYYVNNVPGTPFPLDGTAYPSALANKIAETDLNTNLPDISARFTTNTELATQNLSWNFDHNTPPTTTQIDFVTVVLHELGHGILGTTSATVSMSGVGSLGGNLGGNPAIFDTFVTGCTNLIPITSLPNNSTVLGNVLTGGDLCFLDEFGNAPCTAGGNPPQLYAPDPWEGASSIVHLDDAFYPSGDVNSLMTPFAGAGEQILQAGDLFLCMLDELGWMVDFTTGIEDDLAITTWPNLISEGQNFEFKAAFYDEEPYGDYILNNTHEWKIEPLYNDGFYPLLVTQSTMAWNYWPDQLPSLPYIVNGTWSRNPDGTVRAKATISAEDNNGFFHMENVDIGIPYAPDQPAIQSDYLGCYKVKLSFYSPGATSYEIYYDTDPGVPYNGTGLPQGNSPITVSGSTNSITLTDLAPSQYYFFNVRGKNSTGYSTYAIEEYETIPIEEKECGGVISIDGCVPVSLAILDISDVKRDGNETVFIDLVQGLEMATYSGAGNSGTIDLTKLDQTMSHELNSGYVQIVDGKSYTVRFRYKDEGTNKSQEAGFEVSELCGKDNPPGGWGGGGKSFGQGDNTLTVSPNPANSSATITTKIESGFEHGEIRVLNHYGLPIQKHDIVDGISTFALNTSGFPPGMYFVQLILDNEPVRNQRLAVVR